MPQLPDAVIRLDLDATIEAARRALLESTPIAISYLDSTDTSSSSLPQALIGSCINIYALWTRGATSDGWTLRYIGQRSVRGSIRGGTSRLSEHLFRVHPRTQSQLERVRGALAEGLEIGVTGILVEPDSLRLTIEDELIACAKLRARLWNRKGGGKRVALQGA